ncbi:MAG: hypothetical protein EPN74_07080 [Rhodanobacter sp.]|nr:MAG: hypothetical protein EPN74_07080 [Rhodanobacter sp.]
MKSHNPLLYATAAAALLFAGAALAQSTPPAPADGQSSDQATYQTPQGEVVIKSVPAPTPTAGPAPTFKQLSDGGEAITSAQAAAYPPLANDFLYVDGDHNGSINKTEYNRWVKQLQQTSGQ